MMKKILIDLGFALMLFVAAAFLAGMVSMNRPECLTCGATIGSTIWLAAVLALQPVIWVQNMRMLSRTCIWVIAMLTGGAFYVALEYLGARLLVSGNELGLNIAFYANTVFIVVAVAGSAISTRVLSNRASAT